MCGARAAPSARIAWTTARRCTSQPVQLLDRRIGRQAALHQVPHPLRAVAAGDPGLPRDPHHVQHAGDGAAARPAAGGLPPDRRLVLDLARPQRPLVPQPLEDVRAELRLAVPPGPVAAVARLVHPEAVDLEVLAEHVGRLVRPVLEQRAVRVRELLERALVERAVTGEQDEQVVAGDDRGRVELQAAQRADGVQQLGGRRPAARGRAVEALVADGEPADGLRRGAEQGLNSVGTDRRRRSGRRRCPPRTTRTRSTARCRAACPVVSARTESTIGVTGWCSAIHCSPAGIDSAGTNADDT